MRKTIIYITSIILLAIITFSCTSECYVAKESKIQISFLDSITYKKKNITELTVQGVSNDSILYSNVSVNLISLPLHNNQNETSYKFILPTRVAESTVPDTIILQINQTPKPQLISKECGCVMFHTINDVKLLNNTYNFKLDITNSNITNDDKDSHIKILH